MARGGRRRGARRGRGSREGSQSGRSDLARQWPDPRGGCRPLRSVQAKRTRGDMSYLRRRQPSISRGAAAVFQRGAAERVSAKYLDGACCLLPATGLA